MEPLFAHLTVGAILAVLFVFGLAPPLATRFIILAFPKGSVRDKYRNEFDRVETLKRPLWVAALLVPAVFDGLIPRVRRSVFALTLVVLIPVTFLIGLATYRVLDYEVASGSFVAAISTEPLPGYPILQPASYGPHGELGLGSIVAKPGLDTRAAHVDILTGCIIDFVDVSRNRPDDQVIGVNIWTLHAGTVLLSIGEGPVLLVRTYGTPQVTQIDTTQINLAGTIGKDRTVRIELCPQPSGNIPVRIYEVGTHFAQIALIPLPKSSDPHRLALQPARVE